MRQVPNQIKDVLAAAKTLPQDASTSPSFDACPRSREQYLDRLAASEYLKARWNIRAARQTLAKWLCDGTGPPVFYDGRYPRYATSGLDRWAVQRLRGPYKSSAAREIDMRISDATGGEE